MPRIDSREYRNMEIRAEQREDTDAAKIVTGYASTFDEPYTLYESDKYIFQEVVDKNAFENTDMSDVIMQYDHEGRVFARQSNNTLEVQPDDKGLFIKADLGGTELGRQLYDEIRGGYTDKMSFGFTVDQDDWLDTKAEDGRDLTVRTIKSIRKLYDVSAVSIPANDATSISVRSLIDGEIERLQAERLAAEELQLKRRRAEIRAKALRGDAK